MDFFLDLTDEERTALDLVQSLDRQEKLGLQHLAELTVV